VTRSLEHPVSSGRAAAPYDPGVPNASDVAGHPAARPAGRLSWSTAWRCALGLLTVFPVRAVEVDRRVAGRAMLLAPFAGLLLGVAAAVVLLAARALTGSATLAAALAVGALAWLTRALHLDGLADLADGLGSGKPAGAALDVMKRSDIGPFGVVTLTLTLLLQVAALDRAGPLAAPGLIIACATGRLAITWSCREPVPPARPDGLGALVAGTVRRGPAIAVTAAAAALAAVPAVLTAWAGDLGWRAGAALPPGPVLAPLGAVTVMAAGLGAAALLRRRAVRRLGGITGDVLGALTETAATVALLGCAVLGNWLTPPGGA